YQANEKTKDWRVVRPGQAGFRWSAFWMANVVSALGIVASFFADHYFHADLFPMLLTALGVHGAGTAIAFRRIVPFDLPKKIAASQATALFLPPLSSPEALDKFLTSPLAHDYLDDINQDPEFASRVMNAFEQVSGKGPVPGYAQFMTDIAVNRH